MRNRALAIVFVVALIVMMLGTIPLRAALGWARVDTLGLSAQGVRGSIWGGRLAQAQLGSAALGDLAAGANPFVLLTGGVRLSLRGAEGAPIQRAVLTRRGDQIGVTDLTGDLPLALVGLPGMAAGAVAMEDVSLRFGAGGCEVAEGRVSTDALSSDLAAGVTGPTLAGDMSCASDGAAQVALEGAGGGVDVRSVLAVYRDGRVVLNSRIRASDPAAGLVLQAAGFQASGDGYVRTDQGRLAG